MRIWGMRPGVTIALSAVDRRGLEALVGNRNAPRKHAWRAEIVLLSAGGRRHGRDHAPDRQVEDLRLALAGTLCRGGGRGPAARQDPAAAGQAARGHPLTGAAMAKAAGISVSSVQRIWKAHGLEPHRV